MKKYFISLMKTFFFESFFFGFLLNDFLEINNTFQKYSKINFAVIVILFFIVSIGASRPKLKGLASALFRPFAFIYGVTNYIFYGSFGLLIIFLLGQIIVLEALKPCFSKNES